MKKVLSLVTVIILCFAATSFAQVGPPVSMNLGLGAGVTMPSGDYSTGSNTGYHGAAKLRIGSLIPVDLTGAVAYHHVADKVGSDATNMIQIAAGIEYAIPSVEVKPYLSAEVALNSFSNTAAGSTSRSREGLNIGAGAQFMGFDGAVKYQMLNLMGKADIAPGVSEATYSQITLTVMYTIGL